MTLGEKLRFLRDSRNYTQQQLSGYLHLERAAYANYENGRRSPSYQHIVVIADFFGVRTDYLIRDDFAGNPYRRPGIADQIVRDFCLLDPDRQRIIAEYLHFCARRRGRQRNTAAKN